jgi:hypothetical protein
MRVATLLSSFRDKAPQLDPSHPVGLCLMRGEFLLEIHLVAFQDCKVYKALCAVFVFLPNFISESEFFMRSPSGILFDFVYVIQSTLEGATVMPYHRSRNLPFGASLRCKIAWLPSHWA